MNKLLIFLLSMCVASLEAATITNWGAQLPTAVPAGGDVILMQKGGVTYFFTPDQLAGSLATNSNLNASNKIGNLNGLGTNLNIRPVTGSKQALTVDGFVGINTLPTNTVYNLQIRSPYGGTLGGGILIDNETNSDMRGALTIRAGSTVQGRRYIFFQDINPNTGILMGANGSSEFILYNGYGHSFLAEYGSNANTYLNAIGNGSIGMNIGGTVGGGTNGVIMYDGNPVSGTRQFEFQGAGGSAYLGIPWQSISPDGNKVTQLVSSNGSGGYIRSTDKLAFVVDNKLTMVISNQNVRIESLTPSDTVLNLNGQQKIGYSGAHSSDFGITIGSGSFSGSDGYISFLVGGGPTEYGRINVSDAGTMTISASLKLNILSPSLTLSNNVTILGTTNQVVFGATNIAPVSAVAPTKWVSVQVTGDAGVYRLPLYQ